MHPTREIVILGSGGMVTQAIKRLLEQEMALSCWTPTELDVSHADIISPPDLAVLMPDSWQQMAQWLPVLEKTFASCPWLVLADFRIAGMFVTCLQMHACTLLSAHAPLEEIQATMEVVIRSSAPSVFALLLSRFASRALAFSGRKMLSLPTMREFEIGCAVSFGLSNEQMARTLHIEEATIKSHLHHLFQKLRLAHRQELAAYFDMALSIGSPPN